MKKIVFALFATMLSAFANAACEVNLGAADNMMFDKRKITIDTSCDNVSINFKHTGKMPIMAGGHNVVIIETKDFNTVIQKIDMKLGAENGFLPEMPEVIVKTAIIAGGGDTSVAFDPKKLNKDGKYTFICSFPGHYAIMKGVVEVI